MDKDKIIKKISGEVKSRLDGEASGHDWWHVYRVWKNAKIIAKNEKADLFIVEIASLLHDIADWKFHQGDESVGPREAEKILSKYDIPENIINQVCEIIVSISFKGANVKSETKTIEGKIVQDADRLDAIGAIGIARAMAYGGYKNRPIYDPNKKPTLHKTKKAYMKNNGSSINHFYEKLLLLKNLMNTKTAKKLAKERHSFMEKYLDKFFEEWEGKS
ncbi:MAG: HD domain-containing protein [Minisyncoccales bacterium]